MSNHTKFLLMSAAVVVAGLAAAPVLATVPAEAVRPSIRVEAPMSPDALGTIWFEVGGGTHAATSFGGPR